jgi:4-amino-4-deoxy-L-arabinose transferase-like glycosyltransferase
MAAPNLPGHPAKKAPALTHPLGFTCLLAVMWLLPGLLGHDPWKPDEAQNFGVVYEMLQSGDWVVPTLAGEPYVRNPPLVHVTAGFLARLLGPVMPLHEGARLASGLYVALALLLVAAVARELIGDGNGWLAALALIGSIGLLLPSHLLVPDVAQLAGVALALYGFALALRRPVWGGLALGTGAGMAFLSKGLFGPVCLIFVAALLPALSARWRTRAYLMSAAIAVIVALPWLVIWPTLLLRRAPEVFQDWLWVNNLGRMFGGADSFWPPEAPGYYLTILPWFAFPSLPLAAWAVWAHRGHLAEPHLLLPLLSAAVFLAVLSVGAPREVLALPLLAPLAVLAALGVLRLGRSGSHAFWWFSILFGSFLVLMAWFEWTALEVGFPDKRHQHWLKLQPGYEPHVDLFVVVLAVALTLFWIWLVRHLRRSPERPLIAWAGAIAVVWALAFTMFGEYADAGKSYRQMVQTIARTLPEGHECVSSYNLADPQRAMLHYFAGIRTYREEIPARARRCDVMLVQGSRAGIYVPGREWEQIWEGARRGDRRELYRLYRRV